MRHPPVRRAFRTGIPLGRVFRTLRGDRPRSPRGGARPVALRRVRVPERQHGRHQRRRHAALHAASSGGDDKTARQIRIPAGGRHGVRHRTAARWAPDGARGDGQPHAGGTPPVRTHFRRAHTLDTAPGSMETALLHVRKGRRPECGLPRPGCSTALRGGYPPALLRPVPGGVRRGHYRNILRRTDTLPGTRAYLDGALQRAFRSRTRVFTRSALPPPCGTTQAPGLPPPATTCSGSGRGSMPKGS